MRATAALNQVTDENAAALQRLRDSWRTFRTQQATGPANPTATVDAASVERHPEMAQFAVQAADEFQAADEIVSQNGRLDATLIVKYGKNSIGTDPVYLRSYNAKLVGPTLRAKPGDLLRITIKNELPEDPPEFESHHNQLHGLNTTNLHTHGLHVSPAGKSDNVLLEVQPREQFTFEIKVPEGHPAGTFWYHAHRHGSVAAQVSSGMSGALIISGGLDAVPEIAATRERIFVFQQVPYVMEADPATGAEVGVVELRYADKAFGPGKWDTLGRYTTINGQKLPVLTMRPEEIERWRFIHSGVRESLLLTVKKIQDGQPVDDTIPLQALAYDGLALGKMVPQPIVEMHPGYRADVLFQAPTAPGEYLLVDERSTGPRSLLAVPEPRKYLAKIVVQGERKPMALPSAEALQPLVPYKSIDPKSITGHRRATYSILQDPAMALHFLIDGHGFDPTRPRQLWLGDVDEWSLRSINFIPVNHPFHIHVNAFELVSAKDKNGNETLTEPVWRDTILIPEGWTLTIRTRYEDFTGDFVQHCHILDHEDQGMMELIQIKRP